ncbi:hypothetical protein KDA14_04585, partial [Candidatus Saccharibacteria bacterium]|nr:hypothetical protein [Candidatus Saccharibacteria bacterium]
MLVRLLFVVALVLGTIFSPLTVNAAETRDKGLSISPLRQEMTVKSSAGKSGVFTVANYTEKLMFIDLAVKQFSVTDYVYDYKFLAPPKYDWVKLRESAVILQPGKSKEIQFDVEVPAKTTPGGYYFSLFASTTIDGDGLPGTVQAASLLYLVVDGSLVRTSILQNDSIPFWVTGSEIPYKFDVKNTGNVHFSAYFYGQTETLFGSKSQEVGTGRLLMPGVVRGIEGKIPTPFLPGIYKVNYGYDVDFADIVITKS